MTGFAAQPTEKDSHQHRGIQPVGLRPSVLACDGKVRQPLRAPLFSVAPKAKRVAKEAVWRFGKPRVEVAVGQIDLAAITLRADFGQNEMAVRMISDMVAPGSFPLKA